MRCALLSAYTVNAYFFRPKTARRLAAGVASLSAALRLRMTSIS